MRAFVLLAALFGSGCWSFLEAVNVDGLDECQPNTPETAKAITFPNFGGSTSMDLLGCPGMWIRGDAKLPLKRGELVMIQMGYPSYYSQGSAFVQSRARRLEDDTPPSELFVPATTTGTRHTPVCLPQQTLGAETCDKGFLLEDEASNVLFQIPGEPRPGETQQTYGISAQNVSMRCQSFDDEIQVDFYTDTKMLLSLCGVQQFLRLANTAGVARFRVLLEPVLDEPFPEGVSMQLGFFEAQEDNRAAEVCTVGGNTLQCEFTFTPQQLERLRDVVLQLAILGLTDDRNLFVTVTKNPE